jgi:tetratricopeptide (TPR) repeat protein
MRRFFLFLFCFALLFRSYSQVINPDSLNKINNRHHKADNRKLQILNQLTRIYCVIQLDTALLLAEQSISLASGLGDKKGKGIALYNKALSLHNAGRLSEANTIYKQALDYNIGIGNTQLSGYCYLGLGTTLYSLVPADSLNGYYKNAMTCFEKSSDSTGIAMSSMYSCLVYIFTNNKKSLSLLKNAQEIFS